MNPILKGDVPMVVAIDSFVVNRDGADRNFIVNVTRIRADHPWLKGIEHLFKPLDSHYQDVEQTTQAPGERRS